MSQSPGHRQSPQHKVAETPVEGRMCAMLDGEVVADSSDVLRVDEDHNPPRYYFPRGDVHMDALERTATTTQCPFKGTANYFSVQAHGRSWSDAAWTYEDPYDEHRGLAGRIAFYTGKVPELEVSAAT
jgi:uncharacterized protein (DUF427 family)